MFSLSNLIRKRGKMVSINVADTNAIQLSVVECKRCHHKWVPRVAIIRICPNCKSPYWNVEKTRFFQNNSKHKRKK